jgi:hypothetical protein
MFRSPSRAFASPHGSSNETYHEILDDDQIDTLIFSKADALRDLHSNVTVTA